MSQFNPALFKFNNTLYSLVRTETDTKNWLNSYFGYNINVLDSNLKVIHTDKCKFKINNNHFSEIKRSNIKQDNYTLEDIKIINDSNDENNIVGICNVLIQNKPRIFRCGLVSIDASNSLITLTRILSVPKMNNDEKNWVVLNNKYIIYSLYPKLIIYTINEDYNLSLFKKKETLCKIENTNITKNLNNYYKNLYLTSCQNCIKLNENYYLIICKKRTQTSIYEYYYCLFDIQNWDIITFTEYKLYEGWKKYLNNLITLENKLYLCWGLSDSNYEIERHKIKINLHYCDGWHNFGDELSKFIATQLINKDKYELVFNQNDIPLNIVCIGSYIHMAKNNTLIFGSGVCTPNNLEGEHKYTNLNICSVRGPLTRDFLMSVKNISVPEIYGDPALLLPKFYKPVIVESLKDIIGIVPHKTNYSKYKNKIDITKYYLINPTDEWQNVINYICSCKAIISSALHGLISSDAYNIPNVWLDEFKLQESDFTFSDYFASQGRPYVKIKTINEYDSSLLYRTGNTIDLDKLLKTFPFN